jgi:hypothetical protein
LGVVALIITRTVLIIIGIVATASVIVARSVVACIVGRRCTSNISSSALVSS